MKYFQRIVFFSLFLFFLILSSAQESPEKFLTEKRTGEIIYLNKKTNQTRSKLTFKLEPFKSDEKIIYSYSALGAGDYDKYKTVTWEIKAELEEKGGYVYPLTSLRTIKDSQGNIIIKYQKRFDYEAKKIYYKAFDAIGKVIKEKELRLRNKTIDDATMGYSFSVFVANRDQKDYRRCYIVSDKGKVYKTKIKAIGPQDLEIAGKTIKAIKFQLIYDLGVASSAVGAFIPKTYVWCTQAPPYLWLQYEGLETGLGSTNVRIYLSKSSLPLQ